MNGYIYICIYLSMCIYIYYITSLWLLFLSLLLSFYIVVYVFFAPKPTHNRQKKKHKSRKRKHKSSTFINSLPQIGMRKHLCLWHQHRYRRLACENISASGLKTATARWHIQFATAPWHVTTISTSGTKNRYRSWA